MFATFSATPESSSTQKVADHASQPKPRLKRHQVARACVWCRAYRIKCDASYPCRNCKSKGRTCSDEKAKDEVRTFSLAIKEIDRLQGRVKELEDKLNSIHRQSKADSPSIETPPVKLTVSLPPNLDPLEQHGGNKKYYNWDFISTRTSRTNQQCYGPSSSFYFIGQMTSFLDRALQEHQADVQSYSASRYISSPMSAERCGFAQTFMHPDSSTVEHHLSRSQEESLLVLFWTSYHCIYPILDEAEFKAYHKSLWETSRSSRQPSALVDIVLAVCMQYGSTSMLGNTAIPNFEELHMGDSTNSGRLFYRRCQSLLVDELEGPTIRTFQCYLLSVIWLSNASFQNMAHSVMATGIRAGVILGLHLEPPEDIPLVQRESRKRMWWTLYSLEMKMGMELGRPLAVSITQVNCSIPDDSCDLDSMGQNNSPYTDSFNTHFVKLILATRAIYITFYRKCADVLGMNGQTSLYHDPQGLETCAEFLLSKASYLRTWLQQVPDTLKSQRKNLGQPFSTDRSMLDIRPSPSFRLPRQSLFLELLYHNLSMSLYRPFISFSGIPSLSTPITDGHAESCVNHAITITSILHQVLTETNLLNGWHETFQWQWNATLSLIGYILAYPVSSLTPIVRKALSTAIIVFELLSENFITAVSAANVARDLSAKADVLVDRFRTSLQSDHVTSSENPSLPLQFFDREPLEMEGFELDGTANFSLLSQLTEEESALFQNTLTNSSGFAFTFDTLSGLENIGDDGGMAFNFLDFEDT
ncbi:fungal-specific transcription factor domain-containing protein [Melanomma pulvis-pyrius CBS 109.77]|uniref:Fungal-specific transcription factor domain-containing protein n=1 Tax=Melanomma pulvis-pyrius CBS 109.77 TaxID=1314802 RepID=A0A6A6XME7_9PLEO|nr:fungal-specific transcription factor domain-containing protein [Melanomma pulvis-pyrius CBS 109.77]